MTLTAATLFSGIGAPECAMHRWHWPWHAENEKFPSAVMAKRHPRSVNLGDVTADDFCDRARAIATPDVLVFGSPCQSFSIAGKRLGMDDPRGNLALVALGIVGRLEPRWFILENVPGLLSSAEGRDFGLFLRTVDELGYSLAWTVLDAQHFGVAQRRERVFAVGYLGDWRGPAAVLFEPESLCGHSPPRRETRQGIALCPTLRAGGNRTGGDRPPGTDVDTADSLIVARSLNAHPNRCDGESETFITAPPVTHALRAAGFDASEDGTGRGTPIIADTVRSHPRPGSNSVGLLAFSCKDHGADAMVDLSPTLQAGTHDTSHANAGVPPAIAFDTTQATIGALAGGHGGGSGHQYRQNGSEEAVAFVGSAVRRLTPRECERLQGYSDDYTLIEYRGKPAADGPRYKALGNSMAVPVMRWLLSRIEHCSAAR